MDVLRWEKEGGDGRLRRILWYLSLRVLDLLVKITLARASLRQHRHELPFHCHLRDDRARYSDTISRCQTKEPWKGTAWNSLDHVNPATPHSSEASCIVYEMVLCRKYPRTTLHDRRNSARDARQIPRVNFGHHCLWQEPKKSVLNCYGLAMEDDHRCAVTRISIPRS